MKRIVLPLLFISLLSQSLAQNWAPVGARWHYSLHFFGGLDTYKTITSTGDTIIQGKSCRIMVEQGLFYDTSGIFKRYMYQSNDSVFYYNGQASHFSLLYDFGAQTGDSIFLDGYDFYVKVIATDTMTINGQLRRVQYITGGNLLYGFWGETIEGIGNTVFMFPQGDMFFDGPIRCYEDSTGLYQFMDIPCDTTYIVSVDEIESPVSCTIYPNPASSAISILFAGSGNEYYRVNVYSVPGKRVLSLEGLQSELKDIPVAELQNGLYFIEISRPGGPKAIRKFAKCSNYQ